MPTLAIVEDFDVLGNLADRLLPGFVTSVVDEFIFECSPETFHRRIIVAISPAAHGGLHTELPDELLILVRTILAAAIGVVNESW